MNSVPNSLRKVLCISLGLGLSGMASAPAWSQGANANDDLQEVVITTARQREEALQDVPATITAITADTLEAASVERAGDFVRLTPGVSLVQTAEVADAQVNIRGINGARDAENSFALIIDGVLQTNPAAFNREYADLKQIEIVKGPQGAIYGRNAAAGAIIVTTTKPTDEFTGDFKVGYGEDNTLTGSAVLSGPMSDRAGWKVAADYRKTDGFFRNSFLGRDDAVDYFKGWNITGRFLFEPTESSTLDIKAHAGDVEAASISFNADFLVPGLVFSGLPNAQLFDEDVNTHDFNFVNNVFPYNNQESKDLSVKYDADLSFGKLTLWALYSDIQNDFGSDGTSASYGFFNADPNCQQSAADVFNAGFALPPPQIIFFAAPNTVPAAIFGPYTPTRCDGTQYQVRNQKDYSFEARIASSGDQRLRWLAGVYYLNIDREVGISTGIDSGVGVVPTLFIPAGQPNSTEQLVWDNFKSDIYAAFGSISYDLTDTLELAVAARYDTEERKVHNLVPTAARTIYFDYDPFDNAFVGNAPLNPALNPTINPSGVINDRSRTFSQFEPKVSLTWEASSEWTFYGNWGVGFKSGGFNNGGSAATVDLFINCFTGRGPNGELNNCSAASPVPQYRSVIVRDDYDKEKSSAAELGFKAQLLDRRLSLETSLFYTQVDDMQFFEFLVGQFGLLRVVNNIDKVDIQGIEVGASFRVNHMLSLVGGYSRVQSEIKQNTSRPASVGNESPYTPGYTATLGAEFNAPIGSGDWEFKASAYWNQVGPTWFHVIQAQDNQTVAFGTANFTNGERDRFSTVDARLALTSRNWSFALIGKNITDEKFLQEVIPAPEFGGAFIHPGAERRLSVEVGYKF
ncbi:MAG: TonB-dependent receptor [Steroidobacteraceae bacterium]